MSDQSTLESEPPDVFMDETADTKYVTVKNIELRKNEADKSEIYFTPIPAAKERVCLKYYCFSLRVYVKCKLGANGIADVSISASLNVNTFSNANNNTNLTANEKANP